MQPASRDGDVPGLDAAELSRYQIAILSLCALIAMVDGFDTQAIAFVAPQIAARWNAPIASFGPIFGAGLLGSMIGSLAIGTVADRTGRKPGLIASMALFAVASLATPWVSATSELGILRFVTGLGLGGALPSIFALASEYAPRRARATLVATMFCGFPLGASLGAAGSAW